MREEKLNLTEPNAFYNEISEPYEVPQFPIEQIEKKLQIQQKLNELWGSIANTLFISLLILFTTIPISRGQDGDSRTYGQMDSDSIESIAFQRVSISGEDTSGVPLDDLEHASKLLIQALAIRQRFMELSQQTFPELVGKYFCNEELFMKHEDKKTIEDHPIHPVHNGDSPWSLESPPPKNYTIKAVAGVFNVFKDKECKESLPYKYIKLPEFVDCMQKMCSMIADGPL